MQEMAGLWKLMKKKENKHEMGGDHSLLSLILFYLQEQVGMILEGV